MTDQRQEVLEDLQDVKYVGPALAERLYEEVSIRSVDDIVEAADKGWLQRLDGIGSKRERDILESAQSIRETPGPASDAEGAPSDGSMGEGEVHVKQVDRRTHSRDSEARRQSAEAGEAGDTSTDDDRTAAEADPSAADDDSRERRPRPRIDRFIDRLRCPACGHDTFDRGNSTLTCTACRREYKIQAGIANLAPPNVSGGGVVQRIMESRLYSRFYEDTARPWLTSLVSKRSIADEMQLASELLELDPESVVLDVACGTANFTRHFAEQIGKRTTGYDDQSLVVGMDLSWPMLERARNYLRRDGLNDRVFLLRGDATRMPVGRASFNRIHCAGALHLMDDIDEALRNFARALEPNGICVVGTFLARGTLLWRFAKRAGEIPTDFHWFERDELHDRLERAGLGVVEDDVSRQAITVKARRK